ncbi:MAG: TolC family protein [Burkholderiales bacterium]|nr:TolC family protein [Burkholderiales bacterium]
MRRALLALPVAAALAGCALKPPPDPVELRRDALANAAPPGQWSARSAASGAVADGWLASFQDAQLEALVREAIRFNHDLRIAAARVEEAAGHARLAGAEIYPQVNVLARGLGKLSNKSSEAQLYGVFLSWELDLWGRVRSQREAGRFQYESTVLDAEYARQSIAALVAKSWFLAVEARLQKGVAEDMLRAAERLVALALDRQRVGAGDEYDVTLARASAQGYREAVERLELARQQALRALEALAGRYPAAAVEVAAALSPVPARVPAGIPAELLERRPDVVAAERRVAEAFYRVQESKAARMPRISLAASGSHLSSDLFLLADRPVPVWSLGLNILGPLFSGGALEAQVEIRTAEQKVAVAEYGRIGVRAFGEAESALASESSLAERRTALHAAMAENAHALKLAGVRYRVGSGDLRAVQERLLALYGARTALLHVEAEQLVQRVNLHLALGGGWEAAGAAGDPAKKAQP